MPYTIAHPAVVIPLKARWPQAFSLTGLALGAVGPDLEFFARLRLVPGTGHAPSDLVTRTIPAALLLAPVIHGVVRPTLLRMLPARWARRLRPFAAAPWPRFDARRLLIFLASVTIGFASHLALDAFTHRHGWVVRHVAWFRAPVAGSWMPVYFAAQHGLSWVLLALQWLALRQWLRSLPADGADPDGGVPSKARYWGVVASVTALVTGVGLWRDAVSPELHEGTLAIAPLSGCALGLVVAGLLTRGPST